MTAEIFDRALLQVRRARAARGTAQADYLTARAADDVLDRLAAVNRNFPVALELGAGAGLGARLAASDAAAKIGTLLTCDPVQEILGKTAHGTGGAFVADEERLPVAPASLDLVISLGGLQWTNDLPRTLAQIRGSLKPDGLFLGALVGGASLAELREAFLAAEAERDGGASPRVAPMVDVRDLGRLLQGAGFALPVADIDRVTITFTSPFELLWDLRAMGATNILRQRRMTPLRRATLMRAMEIYAARFADGDGRVRASFEILHAAGWAPDPSQPRPLKPGSATHRLADALGQTLAERETHKP
jgi:SAM-dependent methyltransferase